MSEELQQFIVVDELFKRYIVVVNIQSRITSVYCTECEDWVAEYDGEVISRYSEQDLLEKILSDHEEDFANRMKFDSGL